MSFTLDVSRFVAKSTVSIKIIKTKIIFDIFSSVILKSPVDTGRFRQNWYAGVDEIPTDLDMDAKDKSGGVAINRMMGVLSGISSIRDETVYLVNHVPYGPALEKGHSKQTPKGMVATTISEFGGIVKAKIA